MTYQPVYYGNNFRMFFLDDIDKNVLIIQGVNILGTDDEHSVIYSRRGVELGGGLEKSTSAYDDLKGATTRNVNKTMRGISYGHLTNWPNYFGFTTRYSQIIYNTDIVLRTPSGISTPRTSKIWDALLPNDGTYNDNNLYYSDAENKKYTPTVRIIGGHIYVGAGQTLNISGGRTNPKVNEQGKNEQTLTVSPSSLTVDSDAILNIASSPYANVKTDLFVKGTTTFAAGAQAGGNLVVENGGKATFAASSASRYDGNIYVRGGGSLTINQATVVGDIQVEHGGELILGAGVSITGDVRCAGKLTINGDITLNYPVPGTTPSDDPSTPKIDESTQVGANYVYHGIYVYNDDTGVGTGTLDIPNKSVKISGTSGRIHAFGGYPGIDDTTSADNIFCNDRASNNACRHWTSEAGVWKGTGDSNSIGL
jgi:hypothetical protein